MVTLKRETELHVALQDQLTPDQMMMVSELLSIATIAQTFEAVLNKSAPTLNEVADAMQQNMVLGSWLKSHVQATIEEFVHLFGTGDDVVEFVINALDNGIDSFNQIHGDQ